MKRSSALTILLCNRLIPLALVVQTLDSAFEQLGPGQYSESLSGLDSDVKTD